MSLKVRFLDFQQPVGSKSNGKAVEFRDKRRRGVYSLGLAGLGSEVEDVRILGFERLSLGVT